MASQCGTRERSIRWAPGSDGGNAGHLTTGRNSGVDSHGHVDTSVDGHRNPDGAGLHSKPNKSRPGERRGQHRDSDVKGISPPIFGGGACLIETGSYMPQAKEKGTADQGYRGWVKGD